MRRVRDADRFACGPVLLRLVRPEDCNERYLAWLRDPAVNRYMETRWTAQTLDSIVEFVARARLSDDDYLFAITDRTSGRHVGNIKIGPIDRHYHYADVSYFIGEPNYWGKGLATHAIRCATAIGFHPLQLERLQAGVYEANIGSARALEKNGYVLEGRLRGQVRADGTRQDQLLYGILRAEFQGADSVEAGDTVHWREPRLALPRAMDHTMPADVRLAGGCRSGNAAGAGGN